LRRYLTKQVQGEGIRGEGVLSLIKEVGDLYWPKEAKFLEVVQEGGMGNLSRGVLEF